MNRVSPHVIQITLEKTFSANGKLRDNNQFSYLAESHLALCSLERLEAVTLVEMFQCEICIASGSTP